MGAQALTERLADLKARGQAWSARHTSTTELFRAVIGAQTIDRCFMLTAHLMITAVPMLIAVTAFAPASVRERFMAGVERTLGLEGQAAANAQQLFSSGGSVRETVGFVGLFVALVSATSLSRRLQRMYEAYWDQPKGTMGSSAGRWFAWVLVWIAALAVQGPLRDATGFWLAAGWIASGAMAVLLWWWTPHLMLLGRVGWLRLLPTALATGLASTLLAGISQIVMPTATNRSVAEYGPFGVVLTLMSWLLVSASVIVIGGVVGRVGFETVAREPVRIAVERPEAPGV